MARIPDDELERLKREVSIERLLEARGVALKRVGKDLKGRCPFHGPDEDPSLSVDPDRNVFHCFGCGAKGSVVDLVMLLEGVSFRHAVEILLADYPSPSGRPADQPPPKRSLVPKLPLVVSPHASDGELLTAVALYYHETAKRFPDPGEYLASRGIDPEAVVDRFKLGYSNRTLGYHVPRKCAANGASLRARLEELGVMKETGHEAMMGSLTIPLFDGDGQVVQIYGRKIGRGLRPGVPKHLYLSRPLRGVFNLEGLAGSEEAILCEALLDALTFYSAGFPNVTSAFGANGFTDEHLAAFKAYGITRVLVAYDRDEGGDKAASELAKRLADAGITSFRVLFPHGLDANDYALKVTPAAQALAVLLRGAQHMAGPLVSRPIPSKPGAPPRAAGEGSPPPASDPPPTGDAGPPPSTTAGQEQLSPLAAGAGGGPPTAHLPPPPAPASHPQPATHAAPPAASPIPPPPRADIPAEVTDQQVVLRLGDRYWRVRGLGKNLSLEQLRVNLFVGLDHQADRFHQDTVDLYSAKQRGAFVRQAAAELGLKEEAVKKDVGTLLLKLEHLLELQVRNALEAKAQPVVITDADKEAALELLRDPQLLERVVEDFERCGVVGERTNKLVGYLAAVSRKLDRPLAVMVQSSSAAGKSALMNAVLSFVPEEERVAYSAMTGQSLFYMGEADLKHKVLAIAEEEGAERASYALKQLQSEGELTIASTGKDPSTGRHVTHEYRVQGPTAILTTTTAIDLDEELLNRCLVLTVNEDREQTRAIHRWQREAETLEGYHAELDRQELLKLHRNAQRLLRPLRVVNPHARRLTFLDAKTRTRRDHLKYLALIRAIALLHQHQRPVLSGEHRGQPMPYVEVTLADIEVANCLAAEVLGRTLDELPPQTRRFLLLLEEMVTEACQRLQVGRTEHRFSRADARHFTAWSLTQVRLHLDRLVEMEYILVHRGTRGHSFVYELLYAGEGQDGDRFLLGLLDVDKLRQGPAYGANVADFSQRVAASEGQVAGSKRGQDGLKTGGWRGASDPGKSNDEGHPDGSTSETVENALYRGPENPASYVADCRRSTQSTDEEQQATEEEEQDQQLLPLAAGSEGGRRS